MNARTVCHVLEIARWVAVVIGFQLAFFHSGAPQEQLSLLMPWVVISLAGLSGVESVFLGRAASELSGYARSPYQRQSGMNNLALALVAAAVTWFQWGTWAEITVMSVLLVFLVFSAANHAYSALTEGNRNPRNLLRPVLTLTLVVLAVPFMIRAAQG